MLKILFIPLVLLLSSCGTSTYTSVRPVNPPSSYWDDIYYAPSGPYISPYSRWNWGFYNWRYVPSPPVIIYRSPRVIVTPPRPRYQAPPRRDRLNRPFYPRP
jgi:hypothetical protein